MDPDIVMDPDITNLLQLLQLLHRIEQAPPVIYDQATDHVDVIEAESIILPDEIVHDGETLEHNSSDIPAAEIVSGGTVINSTGVFFVVDGTSVSAAAYFAEILAERQRMHAQLLEEFRIVAQRYNELQRKRALEDSSSPVKFPAIQIPASAKSSQREPRARSWKEFWIVTAVGLVPLVGPAVNAIYHGCQGEYVDMSLDIVSAGVDLVTFGLAGAVKELSKSAIKQLAINGNKLIIRRAARAITKDATKKIAVKLGGAVVNTGASQLLRKAVSTPPNTMGTATAGSAPMEI
eukprot:gene26382-31878_t